MRLASTASYLMAVLLTWTANSHAQIPSGPNSTSPRHIRLVGSNANGEGDPFGAFTVVVRDAANNPIPGATVMLDVEACGELALCPSGIFCAPTLTAVTNTSGVATLVARGFRRPGAAATASCATLYANGAPIAMPRISVFDVDGVPGASLLDVSRCYADVVSYAISGTYWVRSDHDGDGDVDLIDVSISAGVAFGGASAYGCPPCY